MTPDETRTRFLAAIAAQLPPEQVIELHLFGGIRQGGMESGVAVIAVDPQPVADTASDVDIETAAELEAARADDDGEAALELDLDADVDTDDGSPYAAADEPGDVEAASPAPRPPARRFVVYTARYRLTLKGMDRGKWEVSVTEEADAPLVTVDAVVRGVSRRSGDADETIRLSGDEFRAALPEPAARP